MRETKGFVFSCVTPGLYRVDEGRVGIGRGHETTKEPIRREMVSRKGD